MSPPPPTVSFTHRGGPPGQGGAAVPVDQAAAEDERGGVAHLPRGVERAVPALLTVLQDHQVS